MNTIWTPPKIVKSSTGKNVRYNAEMPPPNPKDFVGEDYSKFLKPDKAQSFVERDAIIESIMYIDDAQKELLRRLIVEDGRLDVLMRILGYRSPTHQLILNECLSQHPFSLGLAPRGSGKSTACDICWTILQALKNRNVRILIASRTIGQAQSFLSEIKINLQNEKLINLFGPLRGDKWDEHQIDIIGRTRAMKEHTWTVVGSDGAVVSKHYDIIVFDDLVDESNARSEGERKKTLRFFYRSLLPTLRPDGIMRGLGTRYNPEDLYGYLSANDPSFKDRVYTIPAVFDADTGEAVDLTQDDDGNWHPPPNSTCYDPEGYPMEKLLIRRASMPLADWECQFQNRTSFMQGDYFNSDHFQYYDEDPMEMAKKLDLAIWMGVDLAISQKSENDEFAIVVVGILKGMKECYVLDFYANRLSFNRQKEMMIFYYDKWNPTRTFVEANAYQEALPSTTVEEWPDVRIVPVWTTKDKITRAKALGLYYERKQMFHRKGRCAKLEGQLVGFPDLDLKDLFDALFFAINGALQNAGRKRRKPEDEPKLF